MVTKDGLYAKEPDITDSLLNRSMGWCSENLETDFCVSLNVVFICFKLVLFSYVVNIRITENFWTQSYITLCKVGFDWNVNTIQFYDPFEKEQ